MSWDSRLVFGKNITPPIVLVVTCFSASNRELRKVHVSVNTRA